MSPLRSADFRRFPGGFLGSTIAFFLLAWSVVPPANADNLPGGGEVGYKVQERVCSTDGSGNTTIGGGVFQKEYGKHGVVQFEVKWLLYPLDTNGGFEVAERRKTFRSVSFPNDARNFRWESREGLRADGGTGTYHEWTGVAKSGYKLVAKLRWKRDFRRDWVKKVPVAKC